MTAQQADVLVVGAGVVGLAVARALAQAGRDVIVAEAERFVGSHTSSRNSEVVHAGFHYETGSLKAQLCVQGRRALYEYAAANGVAFRKTGKLVVATDEAELPTLQGYLRRGLQNGVEGLRLIDRAEARALEPEVRCAGALYSAETGIVDSHGFMSALRRDAEQAGAAVALCARAVGGRVLDEGFELRLSGEGGGEPVRCRALVNAAGPWAQELARSIEGLPRERVPPAHFARGHYFVLSGKAPFQHLVYPVAVDGGLGIHLTLDLAGQARFGPDVQFIDAVDYSFDESREAAFAAAIRRYWPALPEGRLQPGYTGVRPKLGPAGSGAHDFVIQGPADHGVPGLVNLFGIESPGLTASLAIADRVAALLR